MSVSVCMWSNVISVPASRAWSARSSCPVHVAFGVQEWFTKRMGGAGA